MRLLNSNNFFKYIFKTLFMSVRIYFDMCISYVMQYMLLITLEFNWKINSIDFEGMRLQSPCKFYGMHKFRHIAEILCYYCVL